MGVKKESESSSVANSKPSKTEDSLYDDVLDLTKEKINVVKEKIDYKNLKFDDSKTKENKPEKKRNFKSILYAVVVVVLICLMIISIFGLLYPGKMKTIK